MALEPEQEARSNLFDDDDDDDDLFQSVATHSKKTIQSPEPDSSERGQWSQDEQKPDGGATVSSLTSGYDTMVSQADLDRSDTLEDVEFSSTTSSPAKKQNDTADDEHNGDLHFGTDEQEQERANFEGGTELSGKTEEPKSNSLPIGSKIEFEDEDERPFQVGWRRH